MKDGIVLVIESMGGGGAQQVAAALLAHWVADGRPTDLITFQDREADRFPVPNAVRRHVIGGGASRGLVSALTGNLRRLLALRRAVAASGAGTIVAFVTSTNVLTILATLGLGKRVVVSERNDPRRQPLPAAWKILRRLSYGLADLVTANTRMAVDALRATTFARHLAWVPNPLRRPAGDHTAAKPGPLLLAVGRLHPQKAYDVLLRAFAQALPALPGWHLRILGGGGLDAQLRRLALDLGIAERVDFAGHVDDPFPHYRAADLFVMASRYEGSPNALWEAMSCGLPAIVSDSIDGAREVESGRLFASGDVAALAQAMIELAADGEMRRRLGETGRDAVGAFAPAKVFAIWDELLFPGGSKD